MLFKQFWVVGRSASPLVRDVAASFRHFHQSQPRHALPLALLVKPFMKLGAALSGRTVRKWWLNLPEKQRNIYRQRLFSSRRVFLAAGGSSIVFGGIFYATHLETVPITGRRRFVALNEEVYEAVLTAERDELLSAWGSKVLPPNHVDTRRTRQLVSRLVHHSAKMDSMREDWKVMVVHDDNLVNAVCFPSGEVIVFTGLLRFVENEHQLAFVIGHEMAHVLLKHGREFVGYASILDWLGVILVMSLWVIIPTDLLAIAVHWLQARLMHVLLELPYSRSLEREADEVGMTIAAMACVDIREASKFWELLDTYEVARDQGRTPEWISTHPASLERARMLRELEGKAMELRQACGCPSLSSKSPEWLGLLRRYLQPRVSK